METVELKQITKRLYLTIDNLAVNVTKLRGYLRLTKNELGVTATDFGLTALGRKIILKDAEGVRKNLLLVNANIQKYREPLVAMGMNNEMEKLFADAVTSVTNDNQLQFEIVSKRKAIVQDNLKTLNELYQQITEILNIGKIIFRNNPVKRNEYVFSRLMKNVRK
jgi:hypothetical protein